MPELPEVEVVRAGLAPAVTGATVASVSVWDERALTRHDGPAEDFAHRLAGATLAAPERRGKFLWIPVAERGEAVLVHLGMSGQVLLREPDAPDAPDAAHLRISLALAHPEHGPLRVDFVDQRTFGSLAIDPLVPARDAGEQLIPQQVAHIARGPLDPRFDDGRFLAALRAKRTAVKRALLDQTLVSGVGNIYADEALWAARIHPEQPTETLTRPRAVALLAEVRGVLTRALAEGGTSFDAQYVNVNGASGYFSRSLNAYARDGEPCPRCGATMVRVAFANRHSHYCPRCQRVR